MKTIIHRAKTRGAADHGWLQAKHSFSFANYYNSERMNFGVLRVLNDDTIAPGKGFGMHPHDNMEIITIPLKGALQHRDNLGNSAVINAGDIQVMSAGTGVYHSEFNPDGKNETKLFQIWIFPNQQNVEPRYDQVSIRDVAIDNQLYQILSPNKSDKGVWIHQNAWFYMGNFKKGEVINYEFRKNGNGIYMIVIDGMIEVGGTELSSRDAIGSWDCGKFDFKAKTDVEVLLMEVPMK